MHYTSHIEISRTAFRKNIRYLQSNIGNAKFCSVVKGNAYGHGIEQFIPVAESEGIDYFAVFNAMEAQRILQVKKPQSSIMIMGMIEDGDIEWAVKQNISFYVFEFERLNAAINAAKQTGKKAHIHVELETGLHRTGFDQRDFEKLINILQANKKQLGIEGLSTHYAGAESIASYRRVIEQIALFKRYRALFRKEGIRPKYVHGACSAAALTYPETIMDMVRFGIAQYGFWPSRETKMHKILSGSSEFKADPLRRIIAWKSSVMSVKQIDKGSFVSYGVNYMTDRDIRIAVVPVGYADGYSRKLSNAGYVLINGKKAYVIGLVNMNMLLVNVTNLKNIKRGDEVVLIGKQGNNTISVASFIEQNNAVNYELLARLPGNIPRIVVD